MQDQLDRLKESHILRRLKSGDDTAFVEAYDLFAPKIYRHALYRTSSDETAADIMSETFLKAWEYVRESAKEITHLRAFLYRIANNMVVDHYRRRARAPDPIDDELERTLGIDMMIEETVDISIESGRMREAMLTLKIETRELLVMRYLDDLTIDEIAETTGKTKNAVYVALHRAVKDLKTLCSTTSSAN